MIFNVLECIVSHEGCYNNFDITYILLSQNRFPTVVMKFQLNQNFIKKPKLAAINPISPKFNTNPKPLVGKLLKFIFKYTNDPYKNIMLYEIIKIKMNVVNVWGGSILVSGAAFSILL